MLAAANPIHGRYDELKRPDEQIEFQATILSRFDIIFIILDKRDPVTYASFHFFLWIVVFAVPSRCCHACMSRCVACSRDDRLVRHILSVHQGAAAAGAAADNQGQIQSRPEVPQTVIQSFSCCCCFHYSLLLVFGSLQFPLSSDTLPMLALIVIHVLPILLLNGSPTNMFRSGRKSSRFVSLCFCLALIFLVTSLPLFLLGTRAPCHSHHSAPA